MCMEEEEASYRVVQLNGTPEIIWCLRDLFVILLVITSHNQHIVHNSSISGVKSSWITLYMDRAFQNLSQNRWLAMVFISWYFSNKLMAMELFFVSFFVMRKWCPVQPGSSGRREDRASTGSNLAHELKEQRRGEEREERVSVQRYSMKSSFRRTRWKASKRTSFIL